MDTGVATCGVDPDPDTPLQLPPVETPPEDMEEGTCNCSCTSLPPAHPGNDAADIPPLLCDPMPIPIVGIESTETEPERLRIVGRVEAGAAQVWGRVACLL